MSLTHPRSTQKKGSKKQRLHFGAVDIIFPWIRPNIMSRVQAWSGSGASLQQSMTEARATGPQGRVASTKNWSENKVMTDCFNGFDDAAASTPGIEPLKIIVASKRIERVWYTSRVHA